LKEFVKIVWGNIIRFFKKLSPWHKYGLHYGEYIPLSWGKSYYDKWVETQDGGK